MTILNYFKESFIELKDNVTWPSWAEAQKLMVVVAVFSIIFALAVWGVDTVFNRLVDLYFKLIQ
ncbi:preprotein translocase subunit SecE [Zhouia sp. PK063]|uniref:preprotein translocase subunit SecE n=1 Tax=Zhouia sp. PK063 TaxID=3373602 RepID=UPI0037A3EC89